MMRIFHTIVATANNHMLIGVQIEVSSGVNLKIALDHQSTILWIIGNQLAYRCCHGVTGCH